MNKLLAKWTFFGVAVFFTPLLQAEVTLAPLFQDNAVLQQGKAVPIWGTADVGEKVTVEFAGQKKEAVADSSGNWRIDLAAMPASSQPAEMVVTGKNTLHVGNILVGEVWICSGQSNMEFRVALAQDADREMAAATNPLIRHFKVEHAIADAPQTMVRSSWAICSPSTVGDFSAVAYFFANELAKKLEVPVGVVNVSWGGTPIEAFLSRTSLQENPAFAFVDQRWKQLLAAYPAQFKAYQERLKKWRDAADTARAEGKTYRKRAPRKPEGQGGHYTPSGIFNAMLSPLIPCAARGILWYQGEQNAPHFTEYGALFTAMISDWRRRFGQGDLPFYFVQLASFQPADPSHLQWAFQREAQATALKLPNTGMAVTIDIGDPANIHPKNKEEVGRRLALIALTLAYEKGGEYAGPIFQSAKADKDAMAVTFSHADGLKILPSDAPDAFQLAGVDQVFHPAKAEIRDNELVVSCPEVPSPQAVRYAWENAPSAVLYNKNDLPAAPFRSDRWAPPPAALAPTVVNTPETP